MRCFAEQFEKPNCSKSEKIADDQSKNQCSRVATHVPSFIPLLMFHAISSEQVKMNMTLSFCPQDIPWEDCQSNMIREVVVVGTNSAGESE